MDNYAYFIVILIFAILFVVTTVLLGRQNRKFLMYIPSAIAAVIALAFYINAYFFSEGFGALGYFIMMLIAVIVFVISLITAIVMKIVKRKT